MSALDDIEKLAEKLAQDAVKEPTTVQSMTEALKVLIPFYNTISKKKDAPDDDGSEPNMGDIQRRLRVVEGDNLG